MTVLTEGKRPFQFLLSEANFHRSRQTVTLVASQGDLSAGAVLGIITTGGKYKLVSVAAADGSQNAKAVLCYPTKNSGSDQLVVVIRRDAEVKVGELSYNADVDLQAEKDTVHASLAAEGIIVR